MIHFWWMRIIFSLACVCILASNPFHLYSQDQKDFLQKARLAFDSKDYYAANVAYKNTSVAKSQNKGDLFKAAYSSYQSNDLEFSLKCFEQLERFSGDKELLFYRAKIYQQLNEFDQAQIYYKKYLQNISKKDKAVSFCKNELLRCQTGKLIKRKAAMAFVVPLSTSINTLDNEYSIFPDKFQSNQYYLSAERAGNEGGKRNEHGLLDTEHGIYFADVFKVSEQAEVWTVLPKLSTAWNSSMHDAVVGYLNKAPIILQSRTDQKCKFILDPYNDDAVHLKYPEFVGPLYPEIGDHSITLFQDSILIFSSCRMGGYGGYDLYLSIKRDTHWTNAINLGSGINGPFNEKDPFLANDGQTLYYSSDNLQSIGGFDIFKTKFHPEAEQWEKPINLGIPINSAGDDQHFILSSDGLSGIFSSNRKSTSQGGFDLYKSFFHNELIEQLQFPQGSPLTILVENSLDDQVALFGVNNQNFKFKKEQERKELNVESLYYKDQELLTDPKNLRIAAQILEWMKIYPELTIGLYGHAFEESPISINLYFSIQKASELKNYLESNGISKSRIKLFGLGASFPKARTQINGNPSVLSEKFNKQIEYTLHAPAHLPIQVNYRSIPIPTVLIPEHPFNFSSMRNGISYSIFLGKAQSVLNHVSMKNSEAQFFVEQDEETAVYNYYLGVYKNFDAAYAAISKLEYATSEKPEIFVFKDGTKLNRKQIIDHVVEDADLIRYLNYLNELKK